LRSRESREGYAKDEQGTKARHIWEYSRRPFETGLVSVRGEEAASSNGPQPCAFRRAASSPRTRPRSQQQDGFYTQRRVSPSGRGGPTACAHCAGRGGDRGESPAEWKNAGGEVEIIYEAGPFARSGYQLGIWQCESSSHEVSEVFDLHAVYS
jgi:hypothetical protein